MRPAIAFGLVALLSCAGHTPPPRSTAPARGAACAGAAAPERARGERLLPMLDSPLAIEDLAALKPSPDGRVVAAVGKERTLLFDAVQGRALRFLPHRLIAWKDDRHYYRRTLKAIDVASVDPAEPASHLPDDAVDRLTLPLAGGRLWLRRTERGATLLDARDGLVRSLPAEFPLREVGRALSTAVSFGGPPRDASLAIDPFQPSIDGRMLGVRDAAGATIVVHTLADPAAPRELGVAAARQGETILSFAVTPDGRAVVAHAVEGLTAMLKGSRDPWCAQRLLLLEVGTPGDAARTELADLGDVSCVELLASPSGDGGASVSATNDLALSTSAAGAAVYDLRARKALWAAPARAATLVPRSDRVLTIEGGGLTSRDARTGRGAPIRGASPHTAAAAAFAGDALVVEPQGRGRPLAWSLADASAAPASELEAKELARRTRRPDEGYQPPTDDPARTLALCDELPCHVVPLAFSPPHGTALVLVDPRGSDTRDVTGVLQLRDATSHRVLASVPLDGMVSGGALSEDRRRYALIERPPTHQFGTPIDLLPRRATVFEMADGKLAFRSAEVPGGATVALSPDGATVYVGADDGTLVAFTARGESWRAQAPGGAVRGVVIDPRGRWVAASAEDGAQRVYDAEGGALLATLVAYDDGEWVASTPGGAFTGTPEVEPRVGFVTSSTFEFFSLAQLPARFRDAATVRRRLARARVDLDLDFVSPPTVTLAAEAGGKLRVRVASRGRVDTVRAYVEGRPAETREVCRASADVDLDLTLLPGKNRVSVVAFDDRGLASNTLVREVTGRPGAARPNLRYVAVGISSYPHLPPSFQLPAATNDARAIAAALRAASGEGHLFARAEGSTLLDAQATPSAIGAALGELAQMAPDDVAVVFLAGHGVKIGEEMRFVTGDLRATERGVAFASVPGASVGWAEIGAALARAPGRVLVLLDACHSGHMTRDLVPLDGRLATSLVREHRAGAIVFAAAKGRQPSFEPESARGLVLDERARHRVSGGGASAHGFFTGAVLGALRDPAADADGDGAIQVKELVDAVTARVHAATGGQQTPWVVRRELFGDFALASVDSSRTPAPPPARPRVAERSAMTAVSLPGGMLGVAGYEIRRERAGEEDRVRITLELNGPFPTGAGLRLVTYLRTRDGQRFEPQPKVRPVPAGKKELADDRLYVLPRSIADGKRAVSLVVRVEGGADANREETIVGTFTLPQ